MLDRNGLVGTQNELHILVYCILPNPLSVRVDCSICRRGTAIPFIGMAVLKFLSVRNITTKILTLDSQFFFLNLNILL
jgi:hypothetical protein